VHRRKAQHQIAAAVREVRAMAQVVMEALGRRS
jgi:hypothetical protein